MHIFPIKKGRLVRRERKEWKTAGEIEKLEQVTDKGIKQFLTFGNDLIQQLQKEVIYFSLVNEYNWLPIDNGCLYHYR